MGRTLKKRKEAEDAEDEALKELLVMGEAAACIRKMSISAGAYGTFSSNREDTEDQILTKYVS